MAKMNGTNTTDLKDVFDMLDDIINDVESTKKEKILKDKKQKEQEEKIKEQEERRQEKQDMNNTTLTLLDMSVMRSPGAITKDDLIEKYNDRVVDILRDFNDRARKFYGKTIMELVYDEINEKINDYDGNNLYNISLGDITPKVDNSKLGVEITYDEFINNMPKDEDKNVSSYRDCKNEYHYYKVLSHSVDCLFFKNKRVYKYYKSIVVNRFIMSDMYFGWGDVNEDSHYIPRVLKNYIVLKLRDLGFTISDELNGLSIVIDKDDVALASIELPEVDEIREDVEDYDTSTSYGYTASNYQTSWTSFSSWA
jgi:hypothetical protein